MKLHTDIKLDKWQKEFIETKGDKILCCGRQVGKSVVCAIDAGEYAVKNKNKTILMIAPTERQAFALYDKTLNYITQKYPDQILQGKKKPTKKRFCLKNSSQVWCIPTGLAGLGVRFLTISRLYADEASRIPEEVWAAVTPMLLTTGGDSILLSTPAEAEGRFYDCWTNTKNAFKSFKRFSISSEDCIKNREICETWSKKQRDKALEFLEREKAIMTKREYAQEYEGNFNENIKRFFSDKLIKKCCTLENKNRVIHNPTYSTFLGIDVARLGTDESTLIGIALKNHKIKQIQQHIFNKLRITELYQKIISHTQNQPNRYQKIFVDDGGVGGGLLDMLLETNEIKRKVEAINNSSKAIESKQKGRKRRILKEDLYNFLLCQMETGNIELFNNDELIRSLRSVQFEEKEGTYKIYGNYTHLVEALIRAVWGKKSKSLNIWIA